MIPFIPLIGRRIRLTVQAGTPSAVIDAFQPPGAVVADRPEQRAGLVEAVPGGVEVVVDQPMGAGVQRQIARLAALAGDFQVRHAFTRVPNPQLAQFLAKRLIYCPSGLSAPVRGWSWWSSLRVIVSLYHGYFRDMQID